MANKDLRDYEIVLVISPEATEDEAGATVETITTFIGDRGGVVNHQENWGVRRLAFPIRRFSEGNYFLARFTLDGENVIELGRSLNASQSVLRHMVVRMDKAALAAVEKQAA
ncbi:30S ribosomal protein S6, partial [Dehalococcoidia bacterium]|nr:30S ribosomal protein S6 [Dehalococcoidia bacterium]